MLKTLATVLCFILFTGVFAVATQAGDLELAVTQPRHVDVSDAMLGEWHRQLAAGKMICPTVHEMDASRQQLAREAAATPNPSEAYRIALTQQAEGWLARCRAQADWSVSILKQTPEGRAYLARIVAVALNQLRLEDVTWTVFDAGSASFGFSQVQNCGGACIITGRENMFNMMFDPVSITPGQIAAIATLGAALLGTLVATGIIGAPIAAAAAVFLATLGAGMGVGIEFGLFVNPNGTREPER